MSSMKLWRKGLSHTLKIWCINLVLSSLSINSANANVKQQSYPSHDRITPNVNMQVSKYNLFDIGGREAYHAKGIESRRYTQWVLKPGSYFYQVPMKGSFCNGEEL